MYIVANKTICASTGNQRFKSARKKEKEKSKERRPVYLKQVPTAW